MSTLKRFAGQTAIYGLSTIASRVLNFFLTPIYTKQYATAVYGIFTTMFAWASIINAVLAFGMETTFFRFLIKYKEKKDLVYACAFITITVLAAAFFVTAFCFSKHLAEMMQPDPIKQADYVRYIRLFAFILSFDALCVIPFAKLRAEGRPMRYAFLKLTNIFSFIGLNLLFIFVVPYIIRHHSTGYDLFAGWFRSGWIGYVFWANLLASGITLVLMLPELLQLKPVFSRLMFAEMMNYSWPVLFANISFVINENLDKILLGAILPAAISENQVGIYGACGKIAVYLNLFVQAFRLGAEPFYFSQMNKGNAKETYVRVMDYFVIAIVLAMVGIVANIQILKYFISGPYWVGLPAVPVLLLGYVCLGIYMNLSVWYKLSDQTRFGLYISGVGAVLTIVLNFAFIPRYGFMAAAWVSLAAYASMMLLSLYLGNRNYPIPYNLKKNGLYLLAGIICTVLSFVIFKRNLIIGNAIFILLFLTTIYAERTELKRIWKKP